MPSKEQTHSSDKESAKRRPQPALGIDQLPQPQLQPATLQQAQLDPGSLTPRDVLRLHRLVGNRAVVQMLAKPSRPSRPAIQPKLTVGAAGDSYEQEADRTAERVMSMPTPADMQHSAARGQPGMQRQEDDEVQAKPLAASITPLAQRAPAEEEEVQTKPLAQRAPAKEEEVQTKPDPMGSFEAGSAIEGRLAARHGGGSPLPGEVRAFMEPRFGADFGGVRVHADGEAAQLSRELSAQAFTHGQDVYVGTGRYDPGSTAGKRLLAHELTHVVQQTGGGLPRVQRFSCKASLIFQIMGPGHEILTEEIFNQFRKEKSASFDNLKKRPKKSLLSIFEKKPKRELNSFEKLIGNSEKKFKNELIRGSTWNDNPANLATSVVGYAGSNHTFTSYEQTELNCLHAMARRPINNIKEQAKTTHDRMLKWVKFCYKVAVGEITKDDKVGQKCETLFDNINSNLVDWTVGFLFGTKDLLGIETGNLKARALGSLMHVLEDSFCASHANREVVKQPGQKYRRIKSFHRFKDQDQKRHGLADKVASGKKKSIGQRVKETEGGEEIASIGKVIMEKVSEGKKWDEVKDYFNQVFGLAPGAEKREPTVGRQFRSSLGWTYRKSRLCWNKKYKTYDDLLKYKYKPTNDKEKKANLEKQLAENTKLQQSADEELKAILVKDAEDIRTELGEIEDSELGKFLMGDSPSFEAKGMKLTRQSRPEDKWWLIQKVLDERSESIILDFIQGVKPETIKGAIRGKWTEFLVWWASKGTAGNNPGADYIIANVETSLQSRVAHELVKKLAHDHKMDRLSQNQWTQILNKMLCGISFKNYRTNKEAADEIRKHLQMAPDWWLKKVVKWLLWWV